MKLAHAALAIAAAAALPWSAATAADIDSLQTLAQNEFRLLSEDLAAALSFKPLIPSEAMGLTGFDVGLAVTGTTLKNPVLLSKAARGQEVPRTLPVPSLRAHKGLPFNIDVGVLYATAPDTNIRMLGGELRWAVLPGTTLVPAVALRIAATRLDGVDQLKFETLSGDISVSKGFAAFTPYGGIGQVRSKSTPQNVPLLRAEKFEQTKVFAGVNINLGVNFAFEIDSTGGITSYGAKIGVRF